MARKAEVIITCDASTVKSVLDGLNRELAKAQKQREKLLEIQKSGKKLTADEAKELERLTKYENALEERQQKTTKEMKKFDEVMSHLSKATLKDLKKALQEGKTALNNMSEDSKGRKKLVDDLKRIQQQIDKNTGAFKKQGSALATTAKNLATYMVGFAGFNKLKSLIEGVFKANLKLSDSLANIRKVSGLSGESINQLYRNISKIDTRNTIEMLNELAYTGAKLGIGQNYGVGGLTGFVKAAEQVQMALGEDMGEKALPELSKMVEVMGLIKKYGVEQSMQKAASSIFQLGATSTATGAHIVEFSKRLMGLANVSRISTQDLLALGSASDAMGLMPEVSATAFNKLFTSIQKNHNLIEQSLGMTEGTIKRYFEQGKTMDAIVEIFHKMNERGNMNLLGGVFKDLGSDGARLVNVMATMADRYDILEKHLETSRKAFEEGEAVIGEYMIQNQTAAAMMERASNLWAKAFTNPEGVSMVKEMAQAWYDLSKQMTQSEAMMWSLHKSINFIAGAIGLLIKFFPYLLRFGMWFAGAYGIRAAIMGLGSLRLAFVALYRDARLATGAMATFSTVMKSNIILAGLSAAVAAISMWVDSAQSAEEAAERAAERELQLARAFGASRDAVNSSIDPLRRLKEALDSSNLSEEQKLGLIKEFKSQYQDYLDYLGIEINSALDLAKAYTKVAEAMKLKKAYEERENYRTQMNGENRMDRIAAQAQVEAAARSMGLQGVDKEFLEKNWRKSGGDLFKELVEKRYGVKAFSQNGGEVTLIMLNDKMVDAGTQHGPRQKLRYKTVNHEALYNAVNDYLLAYRAERDTNKEVDAMFEAEYKGLSEFDIDEFNRKVDEARWKRGGSLDNNAPDKDALKQLTKEEAERKKRLRKEMEDAEKDSTAVINAIEEFYRLQESAIEQLVADGKMTREEADRMVQYLRNRKDLMLMNARRAIAGKDSDFERLRTTMGSDLLRPGDVNSQRAMNTVQTIDVQAAAARLARFDGTANVFDLNSGAFTQSMLKNAAQNELNIQRRQAAVTEEIDKLLMQYQFIEQAQKSFGDKLVKLGLITDGYDKVVQQLADGTEIVANTRDVQALANKIVGMDNRLYGVDASDANELANMIRFVTTNQATGQREDFASIFKDLDEWLDNPDRFIEQMQALYQTMIDMDSEYYAALKKNYDREKKIFEERWQNMGWTAQQEREDRQFEMQESLRTIQGEGMNFGQTYGFADTIADDPEIARIKNRMEARARELADLQAHSASEELIMKKQNEMLKEGAALAEKVSEEVADRIDKVQTLSEPLNSFGEEVGQKLGEIWQGISQEGKLSFGEMVRNMGIEYAKLTLKMASENLMKKLQQALYYKEMEAQAVAHQATLLSIQTAGNTAEIAAEGAKAATMTAFGISSGAAKTIAKLGWWGIPLIGVITSILMGLLNSAKATAAQSTASDTSTTSSSTRMKLVSNMLTYDGGNVQRFVGTDGRVYNATPNAAPGTGLVTQPIATTVQGQPALVAENGPEIVIGRRTTRAIMMNEPGLIKYLASYEQRHGLRLFDAGNLSASATTAASTEATTDPALLQTLVALQQTTALLQQELAKGVRMNMYGTDGAYESLKKATKFMSRYGG